MVKKIMVRKINDLSISKSLGDVMRGIPDVLFLSLLHFDPCSVGNQSVCWT